MMKVVVKYNENSSGIWQKEPCHINNLSSNSQIFLSLLFIIKPYIKILNFINPKFELINLLKIYDLVILSNLSNLKKDSKR